MANHDHSIIIGICTSAHFVNRVNSVSRLWETYTDHIALQVDQVIIQDVEIMPEEFCLEPFVICCIVGIYLSYYLLDISIRE